jgi:hypothetical protein
MQQEACDKVYFSRILRGTGSDGFYTINKLGALGADLSAVACFFDPPWSRVSPDLTGPAQAWLLNQAAFCLRALGRLTEALELMRAGLDARVALKDWLNAAISAGNVSELELTLGEVEAAIRDGEAAVAHAERSGDGFRRLFCRTTHADALQQGDWSAEAGRLFAEAEAMQAERQPGYPLLYSLQGFRHCDWLLAGAEHDAWRFIAWEGTWTVPQPLWEACRGVAQRATQTLTWMEGHYPLLSVGLDHLALARAALYAAILDGQRAGGDHLREAADFLRRAGQQDYFCYVLLTRALFRGATGAFGGACDDLNEAHAIAKRGPMRLFLADIHLHRARLFGLMASRPAGYPWTSPRDDLDAAARLIDECGYGRRRAELADAEGAFARLYGAR